MGRAVKAVRDAIATNDADRIRRSAEELEQALPRIGQAMYAGAAAAAGGTGGDGRSGQQGSGSGSDDDVVDAEFREV